MALAGRRLPPGGTALRGEIDWDRRYRLMRTHTAMHALCGIIWDRFQSPVTGGNMEPGEGRLDFELPDWDRELKPDVEAALNMALEEALPVEVSFLPRRGGRPGPQPDPHQGEPAPLRPEQRFG